MPQAREVTCPSEECKHVRTIKAAPGVRLSCPKCGTKTRAPEIDSTPPAAKSEAPAQPKGTKTDDGIEIVYVDEVKFPRNAHVKKPKDSLPPADPPPSTSGNEDGNEGGNPPPPSPVIPPPPANQERFQHAGRRGGSNFYKQRREAKRGSRRAS